GNAAEIQGTERRSQTAVIGRVEKIVGRDAKVKAHALFPVQVDKSVERGVEIDYPRSRNRVAPSVAKYPHPRWRECEGRGVEVIQRGAFGAGQAHRLARRVGALGEKRAPARAVALVTLEAGCVRQARLD